MKHGICLFTSDRGITPATVAVAIERLGFDTLYVPEHTHIPVKREAAHPTTGGAALPDDRYARTLDPWVSLATAAAVTSRIRLATAVALPVEGDPITLAKTLATLDYLSGGRVTLGVGFGWNIDELADHQVPGTKRRTVLREYLEAMTALWTQEEASYDGEFVSFGPSWAFPKPPQGRLPILVGAGGTDKTFDWICANADGWINTPQETAIDEQVGRLRQKWHEAGRTGEPEVVFLGAKPKLELMQGLEEVGVTECAYGLPDSAPDQVLAYLERLAGRLDLTKQVPVSLHA